MKNFIVIIAIFLLGHFFGDIVIGASKAAYNAIAVKVATK